MIISTEAVVLHSRKFGDTSKIVSFYTQEDGLISTIAKGSRALKNKFGSSLDPLNCSEITYYRKPNRDLFLLSKAELVKTYKSILTSYDKMIAGLAVLETVSQSQTHHEPNENLYKLIFRTLDAMNTHDEMETSILMKFLVDITSILGFDLDFHFLNFLDEIKNEYVYLSVDSGEFGLNPKSQHRFKVRRASADYLFKINSMSWDKPDIPNCTGNLFTELRELMSRYLTFHFDKRFTFRSYAEIN
jgi:DNA repair protein RecO